MLQNLQYKLTEILPLHIRKEVYEKAIIYFKKMSDVNNDLPNYGLGLCTVLPCFLYNSIDLYSISDELEWDYRDTPTAFPEIQKFIPINNNSDYCLIRIGILEQCLKIVNKLIENDTSK